MHDDARINGVYSIVVETRSEADRHARALKTRLDTTAARKARADHLLREDAEYQRLCAAERAAIEAERDLTQRTSDLDRRNGYQYGRLSHHVHVYTGGPPPKRLKRMQLAHETRARRHSVPYDLVDLRDVYAAHSGVCGICKLAVGFDEFSIDHIVPISSGGPHVFSNLQPTHKSCNSHKGNR